MAAQYTRGETVVSVSAPFVYRVATPWLAARADQFASPALPRWLDDAIVGLTGVYGAPGFYAVNILGSFAALMLLVSYLRLFVSSATTRLLLVTFWMIQWHTPVRYTYFAPVNVEPLFLVCMLLALLVIERLPALSAGRGALVVSVIVFAGTFVRESMLLMAVVFAIRYAQVWKSDNLAAPDPRRVPVIGRPRRPRGDDKISRRLLHAIAAHRDPVGDNPDEVDLWLDPRLVLHLRACRDCRSGVSVPRPARVPSPTPMAAGLSRRLRGSGLCGRHRHRADSGMGLPDRSGSPGASARTASWPLASQPGTRRFPGGVRSRLLPHLLANPVAGGDSHVFSRSQSQLDVADGAPRQGLRHRKLLRQPMVPLWKPADSRRDSRSRHLSDRHRRDAATA